MMKRISDSNSPEIASVLNSGGIVVLRTDTLYGVLARADNEAAVQRVYDLKSRDETKSSIVLIQNTADLFDAIAQKMTDTIATVWPGKVSIIMPSFHAPLWIRRENNSVAYRLPDDESLRVLISQTGPLIAPSANPQGLPPAMNIQDAIDYFGETVDLYVDGGEVIDTSPSKLYRCNDEGKMERLR